MDEFKKKCFMEFLWFTKIRILKVINRYDKSIGEVDVNNFIYNLTNVPNVSGDAYAKKMFQFKSGQPYNLNDVFETACAYCAESVVLAEESGCDFLITFPLLTEANYWSGVLLGLDGVIEVSSASKLKIPSAGGKKRSENFDGERERLLELLQDNMPGSGWSNVRVALDELERLGNRFSVKRSTLEGWIRKMSEQDRASFLINAAKNPNQPK